MLAVIRRDAIAAFAQPRACPLHDFETIEASLVVAKPDRVATREALERYFLHRSAPQSAREACVVNDAPVASVDPMMRSPVHDGER